MLDEIHLGEHGEAGQIVCLQMLQVEAGLFGARPVQTGAGDSETQQAPKPLLLVRFNLLARPPLGGLEGAEQPKDRLAAQPRGGAIDQIAHHPGRHAASTAASSRAASRAQS
jgi:hypothetical protein